MQFKEFEEKSFILFKTENRKSVSEALLKVGVLMNEANIKNLDYSGTDMSGRNSKDFEGFEWVGVELRVEEAEKIDNVVYATPFYKIDGSEDFPLTNFIYVFLKNEDLTDLSKQADMMNLGMIGKFKDIPNLYLVSCTKNSKGNALEMANLLCESKLFEGAEPIFISAMPQADPLYNQQWYLKQNATFYGYAHDIKYESALSLMPNSNNGIIVGVIDNGVDLNHPDLLLNSFSWNGVTSTSPSVQYTYTGDQEYYNYHGTNVAGLISAIPNNEIGITGIASKSNINVMSFSINYNSTTFATHAYLAIKKAVDEGVSVINCSWNCTYSQVIENAINYAVTNGRNGRGTVLVFCAGNYFSESLYSSYPLLYPASHSPSTDIITVGGLNYNGYRYREDGLVHYGARYGDNLDLVAPGNLIMTTMNKTNNSYTNAYGNVTGTSFAAPQVAAIAAQILAKSPYLSYKDVEFILLKSANKSIPSFISPTTKQYGTWNSEVGYGMLNAYDALTMAGGTTSGSTISLSGTTSLTVNSSGYAGTTLSASPSNSNYTYIWSGIFTGSCDRWYIWPSGGYSTGSNAEISVYLTSGQAGGTLAVTCRAYNGTSYIGSTTTYVTVTP